MGKILWLARSRSAGIEATLSKVNAKLAVGELSITGEEAQMIAGRRAEALTETERVEFGAPAVVLIAEAVATSPSLSQMGVASDLAELQDAFYAIRNELPADVPDAEIVEALRGCLDEWGDAAEVTSLHAEEVMRFSDEYARMTEAEGSDGYCIADDKGRVYSFAPADWDYDEQADGWDGEGWADGWND